ncbi:uncharacterized protein LOC130744445 [Lotus japonicus]|uniref:uncharacterized protein LOC130744445 n=1 Tax=Lotus japonicus TaxID=34305 RepID=UPI0025847777|nr:uncharacterized protein LOC130744445 [Lotus japonicus]
MRNSNYFQQRVILAPTLDAVSKVNEYILSLIPEIQRSTRALTQFANQIRIQKFKVVVESGVPVILIRNIDQTTGLGNGTRLIINDLGKNIIAATVLKGRYADCKILLTRMTLIPQTQWDVINVHLKLVALVFS